MKLDIFTLGGIIDLWLSIISCMSSKSSKSIIGDTTKLIRLFINIFTMNLAVIILWTLF